MSLPIRNRQRPGITSVKAIYQQQRLFAGLPIYALNRCHELDMPGSTDKDVQIMQWHLQGNDSQHCATYESRLAKACRKSYTLQNPDFCGPPVFAGSDG